MSYRERLMIYEREKKIIAQTAKSAAEYERRIRELTRKLKI